MASIVREGKINICRLVLGAMLTNTYIIYGEEKEALIADPADNADIIEKTVAGMGLSVKGILLTHGHFDHIGALKDIKAAYGADIYAGADERQILESRRGNLSEMFGAGFTAQADIYLNDAQEFKLAGFDIRVIHTPGHTAGSVCYLISKEGDSVLISGDTLFAGSCGRYDFPTGSRSDIMRSIREKLLILDDGLKVYPGHNEATSIGAERKYY